MIIRISIRQSNVERDVTNHDATAFHDFGLQSDPIKEAIGTRL